MNKKELIKHIEDLPYNEGLIVDTIKISRKGLLGLVNQLDEPEKVKIPSVVAQWIGYAKGWNKGLHYALSNASDEVLEWLCVDKLKRQGIFARAWLDGYEIEEEKRYIIKFKNIQKGTEYLKFDRVIERWYFGLEEYSIERSIYHTRKEIEEAGFGWVFDCPGVKVKEATE